MRMGIEEYKQRVMNHFKAFTDISKTIQEDWELLAGLFSEASENGEMEDFDKRLLSEQEFKELYEIDEPDWVAEMKGDPATLSKQEEQTFKDGLQQAENQGVAWGTGDTGEETDPQ